MTSIADTFYRPRPAGAVNRRYDPLETIFLVFAIVFISGMFRAVILAEANRSGGDREAGSALQQLLVFGIYGSGIALLLIAGVTREMRRAMAASWPLLFLVGIAAVSFLWSVSPETSLRRVIALLLTVTFVYYVYQRYTLEEVLRLLFWILVAYMVVGILAAGLPGKGITPDGPLKGSWRGFTGIKNEFGRILSLIIALAVCLRLAKVPLWTKWWMPMAGLAVVLLVLSQSKTSLVAAFGGIAGCYYFLFACTGRIGRVRFTREFRLLAAGVILIATLAFVFIGLPIIVEALGRDLTLSGRTRLWEWAINLSHRPWLGAGYRTFWIDQNTKYFFEDFAWDAVSDSEVSDSYAGPANGHNGYLDIWLELGYFGLAAFAVLLFSAFGKVARCFAIGRWTEAVTLATVTSFLVIYSITERVTLQHSEGLWFLFMLTYVYAACPRALPQAPADEASAVLEPAPAR